MTRLALISLLVVGCAHPVAPIAPVAPAPAPVVNLAPATKPRNLVCERFSEENSKAVCVPEETDVGELHWHRARVTIGGGFAICTLNLQQPTAVCGPTFYVVQQEPEQKPDARPAKAAPKK
jgi:hypothetical protein